MELIQVNLNDIHKKIAKGERIQTKAAIKEPLDFQNYDRK